MLSPRDVDRDRRRRRRPTPGVWRVTESSGGESPRTGLKSWLGLSLTVTLGKSLPFSQPWFFESLLLRGLSDTLSVQSLLHGLRCNRCTIKVVSDSLPPSLLFWFLAAPSSLPCLGSQSDG